MSKKNYIQFAKMFKENRDNLIKAVANGYNVIALQETDSIIHKTADIFEQDNPQFNREKFLKACGII